MINGAINPFNILGNDPEEFLRLLMAQGDAGPQQYSGGITGQPLAPANPAGTEILDPIVPANVRPLDTQVPQVTPYADEHDERMFANNGDGRNSNPYGIYRGQSVTSQSNPLFRDRLEQLGAERDDVLNMQTSRANESERYAVDQTSRAGMLSTAGGILSRSLPDASPYINARTARDTTLNNAENTRLSGRVTDNDKLDGHIREAFTDAAAIETQDFDRRRTRFKPVEDMMTADGRPVFLDQDAEGGPKYFDTEGNQINDLSTLRPLKPDTQILQTDQGYAMVNNSTGEVRMLTSGGTVGGTTGAVGSTPVGFDASVDHIIDTYEGGDAISERDDRRGGIAKYGINSNANPGVDIRNLTREEAREIYRRNYWEPLGLDAVAQNNPALAYAVFDTAINMGPGKARTLMAASGGDVRRFNDLREQEYARIARIPGNERYANGWASRLEDVRGLTEGGGTTVPGGSPSATGQVLRPAGGGGGGGSYVTGADGVRYQVAGGRAAPVVGPDGQPLRVEDGNGGSGGPSGGTAAERALTTTRTRQLDTLDRQLDRLEELEAKLNWSDSGITGGWMDNRIADSIAGGVAEEYDAQVALVRNTVRGLTRVPGEGSSSDYDARQIEAMIPTRDRGRSGRRESISELRNMAGDFRGATGIPASSGATSGAPREGATRQLSSGRTVTYRGGRWQ